MSNKLLFSIVLVAVFMGRAEAQTQPPAYKYYLGIQPSVLVEPYDTIDAVEINVIPFALETRIGEYWGFQIRPIANYRIYEPGPGISQVGAGVFANRYLPNLLGGVDWLVPVVAPYSTYTYNRLDQIHTLTVGGEFGVMMLISDNFTLNVNLQPGINYYPTEFSREFVESPSGFLSHFGVIVHFGYHLGDL